MAIEDRLFTAVHLEIGEVSRLTKVDLGSRRRTATLLYRVEATFPGSWHPTL